MTAALGHNQEAERLAALRHLELLDSEPEEAFDALTRLASNLLGVPIAVVSLVDATRQWFKSRHGLEASETPREVAFCSYAILDDEPLVVSDATQDARFAENPLVTDGLKIRAYAGVPLRTSAGHAIGTLCAIDQRPRHFSPQEIALLKDLASIARREILHRETALTAKRVAAESVEAVSKTEKLYQASFERAAIGIAIVALDGRWMRLNPTICRILGRSEEALKALTVQDVTHPEERADSIREARGLVTGGAEHFNCQKRYVRPDGDVVWANLTVTLVRDEAGAPVHFVSVVEDITAKRATEVALQQLHQQLEDRVQARTEELQLATQQLGDANAKMEDLYHNAPCGYYSLNADGVFVQINETSLRLFGCTREELLGVKGPRDFFTDAGKRRFAQVYPRFKADGFFGPEEFDLLSGDGVCRRISVMATALKDPMGNFLRSRTVIFDVTELHRTRHALQTLVLEQERMLDNELLAIAKLKDRHIVWANRAFERLFGYEPNELAGQPMRRLYTSEESFKQLGAAAYPVISKGGSYRGQLPMVKKSGQCLWVDMSGAQLSLDTGESLWTMVDISAMKRYQTKVEALAFNDALTGLPNRMLLMDRLSQALAAAERSGQVVAVGFADLNGFKAVNDQYGHEAGDLLLREVGKRLKASVRPHDTVARLGGDEFVVVVTQLRSAEECDVIFKRAAAAVATPVRLSETVEARVSASFGVAHGPERGLDAAGLIARADASMYVAKREARLRTPSLG